MLRNNIPCNTYDTSTDQRHYNVTTIRWHDTISEDLTEFFTSSNVLDPLSARALINRWMNPCCLLPYKFPLLVLHSTLSLDKLQSWHSRIVWLWWPVTLGVSSDPWSGRCLRSLEISGQNSIEWHSLFRAWAACVRWPELNDEFTLLRELMS